MATYDEIIAYAPLASYLSNRDTAAQMPTLVAQAQEHIVERMDHDFFREAGAPATISAAGEISGASLEPERFLELRSVSAEIYPGRFMPLTKRLYETMLAVYFDDPTGIPVHYSKASDGGYRVFPAPGREVSALVSVNVAPLTLSPDNQINAIATRFPSLFRAAVAREVALFNMDPAASELHSAKFQEHLDGANAQISRWARDESAQRPVDTRNVIGT